MYRLERSPAPIIQMKSPLTSSLLLVGAISFPARAQAPRDIPPQIDRYFKLVRAEYSGDRARELVAYVGGQF